MVGRRELGPDRPPPVSAHLGPTRLGCVLETGIVMRDEARHRLGESKELTALGPRESQRAANRRDVARIAPCDE
jgi:hypothetical protein